MLLQLSKEVSGTQILEYFNIFLAPFMKGLKSEDAENSLRLFIYNLSNNVDATLSLELTVPDFLASKPVLGCQAPSVYGDYVDECRNLAFTILKILAGNDLNKPLANPKVIVKLRHEAFKDEESSRILLAAHSLAAERGMLYFANNFKDGEECTVFSPSSFKLKADLKGDWEIDTLRTGVLGIVTINLPRIARESDGNENILFEKLRDVIETAMQAIEVKNRMLKQNARNFLQLLTQSINGDQYFRLENSARMINIAGLEEALEIFNSGRDIYEGEEFSKFAVKILRYIFELCREYGKRFLPSMAPSLEASYRLAKQDIEHYGLAKTRFRGTRDKPYYSTFNKIDAGDLKTSLKKLAVWKEFYSFLTGGNLTVVELGETEYKIEELVHLTERFLKDYGLEFFTYNRSLTYCRQCHKSMRGILHRCPSCGSVNSLTVFNRYP
jgi:ribonucleoside-triphosphate reductase